MKQKVSYLTQINSLGNDKQVKTILENANDKLEVNINNVVTSEMNKQENNFKTALEEKRRRKTLMSTSDMKDKIEVVVKHH